MTGGVAAVSQALGYVSFAYPSNVCTVSWTLQGSPDLVHWVDIMPYALGCPSGDLEVQSTSPVFFYRLKGHE